MQSLGRWYCERSFISWSDDMNSAYISLNPYCINFVQSRLELAFIEKSQPCASTTIVKTIVLLVVCEVTDLSRHIHHQTFIHHKRGYRVGGLTRSPSFPAATGLVRSGVGIVGHVSTMLSQRTKYDIAIR